MKIRFAIICILNYLTQLHGDFLRKLSDGANWILGQEYCNPKWISNNTFSLESELDKTVFGQHIAKNDIIHSLKMKRTGASSKPLVLSFHGTTGIGKSYVSRIIAKNLYTKGINSKFVHLWIATLHFPHKSQSNIYQDQIRKWITGNTSVCNQQLFVIDEVDRMDSASLEALAPFLDSYYEHGIDYTKNIFILISNSGGSAISQIVLRQWESGKSRDDLTSLQFQEVLSQKAFNDEGGLWHSTLIDRHLIDNFIPFLPLTFSHVKECAQAELNAIMALPALEIYKPYLTPERMNLLHDMVHNVSSELIYFPAEKPFFSSSGCKRVGYRILLAFDQFIRTLHLFVRSEGSQGSYSFEKSSRNNPGKESTENEQLKKLRTHDEQ